MVMVESIEIADRAADWAGFALDGPQRGQLQSYADWMASEAVPAGGLGPKEGARLWSRHIGDSLSFAAGWRGDPPSELLDVGSGVGLPGIPLAILWPGTTVTLLDRGGRRTRLLNRIRRILDLPNVIVAQADVFAVADEWHALTFRGAVKAPEAVGLSARMLHVGGRSVLGLSRRPALPDTARDLVGIATALQLSTEIIEVPTEILDGTAWLLKMQLGE